MATMDFHTLANARIHSVPFLSNLLAEMCTDLWVRRVECEALPPHSCLLNINTNDEDVVMRQYWYVTVGGIVSALPLLLDHLEYGFEYRCCIYI